MKKKKLNLCHKTDIALIPIEETKYFLDQPVNYFDNNSLNVRKGKIHLNGMRL